VIDPEVRNVGLLAWRSLRQTADAAYDYTRAQIEAEGISYETLLAAAAPPG
jgi:hypothetical protein